MLRIRKINGIAKEVTLKVKRENGDEEITRLITSTIDLNKTIYEQGLLNESMLKEFKYHKINLL